MADSAPTPPGTVAVHDHRPVPRGVLPRGMQTWLMAGLAAGMVLIIVLTGRPAPAAHSAPVPAVPAPNADRVREYQDRLRIMETRAAQETQAVGRSQPAASAGFSQEPAPPPSQDPLVADRKRREYDSLFASNVVMSRRPDTERPDGNRQAAPSSMSTITPNAPHGAMAPSVDEVADAVVRATVRSGASVVPTANASQTFVPTAPRTSSPSPAPSSAPSQTGPISSSGPLHRLLEGTIIDAVLTNRLDGGSAAPVNCLVTNPVYSHSGQQIVIPAGARVLGETKPVQAFGETRLAVAFHRLLMPDGSTFTLDRPPALNQIGDAGLKDQVNQHYWSTFGAAAAVGLVSGLAQFVGTAGLGAGDGNRTVIIAGATADSTSQAGVQVMNRFLNRLPTVTIREGHRIKIYLTSDVELPAYGLTAGSSEGGW